MPRMASARQIHVGSVPVGGGATGAVQTMTKNETANQTAAREQDVEALRTIVVESPIPVIADIHFNHTLALKAIQAGAHCVRINPGNIGGAHYAVRYYITFTF